MTTHGGDLLSIGRAFARDPGSLLDFSASISPLGPPEALRALLLAIAEQPSVLAAYPDPHARDLVAVLAARGGVPECRVVVANGSAALLDVSVRALATRRCVVPVPAFSEYARALASAGAVMLAVPLRAEDDFALDCERLVALARAEGADTCILSNPHNPSGHGVTAGAINALAGELARFGCASIIDEAFIDYAPDLGLSAASLAGRIVVLRSLTKFYAIPGLRIGYGFAPEPLAERIRAMLPSWPVGTIEQRAALAVLGDGDYVQASLRHNVAARAALVDELQALGLHVFPAAANFVLFDASPRFADTTRLRDMLVREHGIVIRTFDATPYVRVAVRRGAENARLIAALTSCAHRERGETDHD
jgi:histidinol-phosphate/aromatic aminotransferase/cobyric acid decarboxylase-like protein